MFAVQIYSVKIAPILILYLFAPILSSVFSAFGLRKFTLGFNELESTRRNADNVSGTESQLHYTPN